MPGGPGYMFADNNLADGFRRKGEIRSAFAKRQNAHRVTDQEQSSNTTQFSGIDYGAKALGDTQIGQGIDYMNQVRRQLQGLTDQRVGDMRQNHGLQLSHMQQMGGYQGDRINRNYDAQAGSVGAALAGTGLYNSTVQGNMRQGVERNRQESLGQLDASLRDQQLQSLMAYTSGASNAQGENIGAQAGLGKVISDMYARMAANAPRTSGSTTTSSNKHFVI